MLILLGHDKGRNEGVGPGGPTFNTPPPASPWLGHCTHHTISIRKYSSKTNGGAMLRNRKWNRKLVTFTAFPCPILAKTLSYLVIDFT